MGTPHCRCCSRASSAVFPFKGHSSEHSAAAHSQASLTSKEARKAISELGGGIVGDSQGCDLRRRHMKVSQPCSTAVQHSSARQAALVCTCCAIYACFIHIAIEEQKAHWMWPTAMLHCSGKAESLCYMCPGLHCSCMSSKHCNSETLCCRCLTCGGWLCISMVMGQQRGSSRVCCLQDACHGVCGIQFGHYHSPGIHCSLQLGSFLRAGAQTLGVSLAATK